MKQKSNSVGLRKISNSYILKVFESFSFFRLDVFKKLVSILPCLCSLFSFFFFSFLFSLLFLPHSLFLPHVLPLLLSSLSIHPFFPVSAGSILRESLPDLQSFLFENLVKGAWHSLSTLGKSSKWYLITPSWSGLDQTPIFEPVIFFQ